MRQILISSKFFTRSQKFVKTMSSKKQKYLVKWIEVKSWREKTLVNAISNRIVAILVYRTRPRQGRGQGAIAYLGRRRRIKTTGQAWATSQERRATTRHRPAGATSCKLKFVLRYVKRVKIWSLNLKFFSVKKFVKLKWDLQNLSPFNLTNKISKLHLQH